MAGFCLIFLVRPNTICVPSSEFRYESRLAGHAVINILIVIAMADSECFPTQISLLEASIAPAVAAAVDRLSEMVLF